MIEPRDPSFKYMIEAMGEWETKDRYYRIEASNDARKMRRRWRCSTCNSNHFIPSKKNNDYTYELKVTRNRYGEAHATYAKLLLEMREEGDAAQL